MKDPRSSVISIRLFIFIITTILFTNISCYNLILAQDSFQSYRVDVEVPIEMVPVKGGTFQLGDPSDNSQQVQVTVDSFWMGAYEITWDQYNQFSTEVMSNLQNENLAGADKGVNADAISLPTPPYVDMSFGMGTDGYPAISMTHYAASMFTKWLTAKTGVFYRLPTEAEWEYACIASKDNLEEQAWYEENAGDGYQKIGTKEPNAYGLYDLAGNVAEWTTDRYVEDYISTVQSFGNEPVQNPWLQPTELYPRSARGASWRDAKEDISCNKRRGSRPDWKQRDPQIPKSLWWLTNAQFVGFRIVRPMNEPAPEEMEKYWPEEIDDFGR